MHTPIIILGQIIIRYYFFILMALILSGGCWLRLHSRCAIIIKSVFIHFLFLDNDGINNVVCELGILIKYIFSILYFASLRLDMFS